MSDPALPYLSIAELAPRLQSRQISPVEVTQALLTRIAALDGQLKSYATLMADHALDAARTAEREIAAGQYRGPLHGVPVAVKDLCNTAGVRTMAGSQALADHVPDVDATVVARLSAAGAILLGKLNLTEGAMGGYNPAFDIPRNPWKLDHWPGGSSSGSGVATAAGLCFGSLGSDTGGSIRFPSAACGIVGLKPTWGRVSRYGVADLAPSLDHVGPMTRCVADAAIMLQAIAGHDPHDPTSLLDPVPDWRQDLDAGVNGLRIGFDARYASDGVHPEQAAAVEAGVRLLERLGARIVPVTVPPLDAYLNAWPTICTAEAAAAHAATYPSRREAYGPYFREWLDRGASVSGVDYARAHTLRLECIGKLREVWQAIDALACPSMAAPAHPVTPEELYGPPPDNRFDMARLRFTAPYDFNGAATLSVPCGLSRDGLPLSLQLVGHPLSESLLCRIGHAYEQATEWHLQHPPL